MQPPYILSAVKTVTSIMREPPKTTVTNKSQVKIFISNLMNLLSFQLR